MVDLNTARMVAAAAFREGERRDIRNISVVVTDAGGHVRLAQRADSQGAFGIDTATAKAESALGFRLSTAKLSAIFAGNPAATIGISTATNGRFIPIAGAVVMVDGDGRLVGAASISGGNPQADDAIIRVAVNEAGLTALD